MHLQRPWPTNATPKNGIRFPGFTQSFEYRVTNNKIGIDCDALALAGPSGLKARHEVCW